MTVSYLVRSPGTGHSIEELFSSIDRQLGKRTTIVTTIVRLPCISRGIRSIWQNLRFVRKLQADVYHITGDVHYAALALPASCTVLTIHDCILLQKNRRNPVRYALFWWLWYYLPIRRAAVVTAVSEKTRQELIQYVGEIARKVRVIPNGYDPCFSQHPRAFCQDKPVLLQIGTAPHKNLTNLIAAIEGISCTLLIVGPLTGTFISDLQNRRIDYQHYSEISRAEIIRLYARADIVTFISTYEGFGMPILEANAVGRAVLTSDRSPMREVAAGATCLVDPDDIAAIRQGILRLIQDDAYRERLIDAGLENARYYTLNRTADNYAGIYQELGPSLTHPVS